ncbi:uncharacterized, partial [Tachysurus ichikawai]
YSKTCGFVLQQRRWSVCRVDGALPGQAESRWDDAGWISLGT